MVLEGREEKGMGVGGEGRVLEGRGGEEQAGGWRWAKEQQSH